MPDAADAVGAPDSWKKEFCRLVHDTVKWGEAYERLQKAVPAEDLLSQLYWSTYELSLGTSQRVRLKKINEQRRKSVTALTRALIGLAKRLEKAKNDPLLLPLLKRTDSRSTPKRLLSPKERMDLCRSYLEFEKPLATRLRDFAEKLRNEQEQWATVTSLKLKNRDDFSLFSLAVEARKHPETRNRYLQDIALLLEAAYSAHGDDADRDTFVQLNKRLAAFRQRHPDETHMLETLAAATPPESADTPA